MVSLLKQGMVPDGSMVASVSDVAHWFIRIDLLRGSFNYQEKGIMDATHLRWFTRKMITEFFGALDFASPLWMVL